MQVDCFTSQRIVVLYFLQELFVLGTCAVLNREFIEFTESSVRLCLNVESKWETGSANYRHEVHYNLTSNMLKHYGQTILVMFISVRPSVRPNVDIERLMTGKITFFSLTIKDTHNHSPRQWRPARLLIFNLRSTWTPSDLWRVHHPSLSLLLEIYKW